MGLANMRCAVSSARAHICPRHDRRSGLASRVGYRTDDGRTANGDAGNVPVEESAGLQQKRKGGCERSAYLAGVAGHDCEVSTYLPKAAITSAAVR